MNLRPYQQAAHAAAMLHLRKSLSPIVIDAATGAGKSYIIAALAASLHEISDGKAVLCLAPSKELVLQNAGKYELTGNPYSLYSASVGQKSTASPVVFGSPLSVANALAPRARRARRARRAPSNFMGKFCAVVIDEAAGITPTIKTIVGKLREDNPQLRVVGLTATPYRLGEGYIYRQINGTAYGPEKAREPYFDRCVYQIGARELIDGGYLTPPMIGAVGDAYDTSKLELNRMHKYAPDAVERAFVGHGRLTAQIMGEVVEKSRDRAGVLVFAATVDHARECLASLPPANSAMVHGATPPKERELLLRRFLAREIKYLVNVMVLTIGFDAPHVDVIAMLRATESVGLLQQIVGRGLRTSPGKDTCKILDYAGNIERHCPDGDIFSPEIKAAVLPGETPTCEATCPTCGTVNEFKKCKDTAAYSLDSAGYCIDLTGRRIETEYGPLPGHHGRRCLHVDAHGNRCDYRWTAKKCPECKHPNDIAARRCSKCKAELVDPNEKLAAEYRARKKDPTQKQTDRIIKMDVRKFVAQSGKPCLAVTCHTQQRQVRAYFSPGSENRWLAKKYAVYAQATRGGRIPETITYRKNAKTGYFDVLAFDRPTDEEPSPSP